MYYYVQGEAISYCQARRRHYRIVDGWRQGGCLIQVLRAPDGALYMGPADARSHDRVFKPVTRTPDP
jgi:hypothetical protein